MKKLEPPNARAAKQVTFSEVEPARRRPRRHTTGGSVQNQEAIAKAKQLLEGATIEDGQGTLDRKQLITMLKDRYGNKLDRYKTKSSSKTETQEVTHRTMSNNTAFSQSQPSDVDRKPFDTSRASTLPRGGTRNSNSSKEDSNENIKDSRHTLSGGGHRKVITEQIETTTITKIPPPKANEIVQNGYTNETVESVETSTTKQAACIYLQYKDEVHKVAMPTTLTSIHTIQALFVTSFPRKVSMLSFEEQHRPIYIKDATSDIFYELEDLSDVQPRCLLKIHERVNSRESLASLASHLKNEYYSYGQPSGWDSHSVNGTSSIQRTRTLPSRKTKEDYASSLQDFQLPRKRIQRTGSNKSLQSDSVLTRNEWRKEVTEPRKIEHETITQATISNQMAAKQPEPVIQQRTRSRSFNGREAHAADGPRHLHATTRSIDNHDAKPMTSAAKTIVKNASTVKTSGSSSSAMAHSGSKLREKPIVEERATTTVEEQLDDLTELLQSAIDGDPHKRRMTAPGKLNHKVIEKLEASQQRSANKNLQNRASFKATEIVLVKDELERRSVDSSSSAGMLSPRSLVSPRGMSSEEEVFESRSSDSTSTDSGLPRLLRRDHNAGQMGAAANSSSVVQSAVYTSSSTESKPPYVVERVHQSKAAPTFSYNAKAIQPQNEMPSQQGNNQMKELPKPPLRISSKSIFISGKTSKPINQSPPRSVSSPTSLRGCINALRNELGQLRLDHKQSVHNFGEFFTEKQREFQSIVSNLAIGGAFASNGNTSGVEHPVRHKRTTVEQEQYAYGKKSNHTDRLLSGLEEETELLRKDVVANKSIVDTSLINSLSEDLHDVTKSVTDLKYRFGGIKDSLKIVMSGELEIIVREEKFLKAEPEILDKMHSRCRQLSGTLFTLQKLASVQNMAQDEKGEQFQTDINGNVQSAQKVTVTSAVRQTTESRPMQRTVRFITN